MDYDVVRTSVSTAYNNYKKMILNSIIVWITFIK